MQMPDAAKRCIRFLHHEKQPQIFDVELCNLQALRAYDSVECHVVLYPYSREMSSDDFVFSPYEEYVSDVISRNRSAYIHSGTIMDKLFGIALGIAVVLIHLALGKRFINILEIEPLIAVFGAYVLGKELWSDFDRLLINITKHWRLRYVDDYYSYLLDKGTTLTLYSALAKRNRYGKATLLPERMEFIRQSNSETLRMKFDGATIRQFKEDMAHILSIHVDPARREAFQKHGFMLGVKMSLNRRHCLTTECVELFQSFSNGNAGCLDTNGAWIENGVFARTTRTCGRLKYFNEHEVLPNTEMLAKE